MSDANEPPTALAALQARLEVSCGPERVEVLAALAEGWMGLDYGRALALAAEALALATDLGDARGRASSLLSLGRVRYLRSEHGLAIEACREALALYEALEDDAGAGHAHIVLGVSAYARGGFAEAREHFRGALDLARRADDAELESKALSNAAGLSFELGHYGDALESYLAALDLDRRHGDRLGEAYDRANLGDVFLRMGDLARARAEHEQALALARDLPDGRCEAYALTRLGEIDAAGGGWAAAAARFREAEGLALALGDPRGRAQALASLGAAEAALGRAAEAVGAFDAALAIARGVDDAEEVAKTLLRRAGALGGDARAALTEALDIAERLDLRAEARDVHRALAGLARERGEYREALDHFERFHELDRALFAEAQDRHLQGMLVRLEVARARETAEALGRTNEELREANRRSEALLHEASLLARHDPLTGLLNRRAFDDRLHEVLEEGTGGLALLFVDLDGFKGINDAFGHAAGDEVLLGVAAALRGVLRDGDFAARLGGDEFTAVLRGATRTEAEDVAARLLDALAHGAGVRAVRASVGIALHAGGPGDPGVLNRAADAAMYRVKHAGGGGVASA